MMRNLELEFEPNINDRNVTERQYTLTHSDETGQRYLYIGTSYAEEKCNKLRDEVVGKWVHISSELELHIMCTLYSKYSTLSLEERYERFKKHMPRAIAAIINGDGQYITVNNLMNYNIYVHFLSDLMFSKEYYGIVNDYMEAN